MVDYRLQIILNADGNFAIALSEHDGGVENHTFVVSYYAILECNPSIDVKTNNTSEFAKMSCNMKILYGIAYGAK